jgi:hypothetical protein
MIRDNNAPPGLGMKPNFVTALGLPVKLKPGAA